MKILDLHGIRHEMVERSVVNFIFYNDFPMKIITGKSQRMIEIVHRVLDKHGFKYHPENFINYGAYIIQDKTK